MVEEVFIRPLLEVQRREILDFLHRLGLRYRLDSSNEDRAIPRNRIRHELLPSLEKHFNPALVETLAGTADLLRDEEHWMDQEAARALRGLAREPKGAGLLLPVAQLENLHPALMRRVVRAAVKAVKGDLRGWSRRHVEDVLKLMASGKSGRRLTLPGITIGRSFGELWLRAVAGAPNTAGDQRSRRLGEDLPQDGYNEYEYELPVPGRLEIPEAGGVITVEESHYARLPRAKGTTVVLGLSRIEDARLKVRNTRPGDRFRPLGAPGTKSMLRYLMEQRVEMNRRRYVPLVVNDDDVLWVVGHGVSELSRVGPRAQRTLQLSWVEG
jgi:tRNA(Ile)-lysidine synthase